MANNDRTFVQLVGNVGQDPAPSKNRGDEIIEFSLARNLGYGDDAPTEWNTISVWENTKDDRGDLRAFVMKNIHKGSKGVYVEGFLKESQGRDKTFRDVTASRIGLVDFAERSTFESSDDGDEY